MAKARGTGALLLGIWLILTGFFALVPVHLGDLEILKTAGMAILAIVAGVFLLLGR